MMTMALGARMSRGQLLWATLLAAAISIALAGTALVFGAGFASHQPCDADLNGSGCGDLLASLRPWYGVQQSLVGLLWILPTAVGALLGVGITAGELERRTAQISWSLSGVRRRWLFLRLLPTAAALVVLLAVCAGAAELVTRARLVTDQPGFSDYELRSALVPLRGLLALFIGVAVGAQLGRTVPALLVAIAVSAALTVGLQVLISDWHAGSATVVAMADLAPNQYPLIVDRSDPSPGVIPASAFGLWVALESAVYAAVIVGTAIVADAIVAARSPR